MSKDPFGKPLARCANGCDAPPHPPSKVLCKKCFAALDAKWDALEKRFNRFRPGSEERAKQ